MKGIFYRSAALALACIVALSALSVPSFATDYQSTYNFWNWAYDNSWFLGKAIIGFSAGNVCQVSEDGLHHATTHSGGGGSVDGQRVYNCVCDLCGQEFQAVSTDLSKSYENPTGFNSISSDGLVSDTYKFPFTWEVEFKSGHEKYGNLTIGDDAFTYATVNSYSSLTLYVYVYFEVPVDLYATASNFPCYHSCGAVNYSPAYYATTYQRLDGDTWVTINTSGTSTEFLKGEKYRGYFSFKPCCREVVGASETFYTYHQFYVNEWHPDDVFVSPTLDTRPVSFIPSFSYEGEDGKETVSDQQIIDEQGLIYYNPVTNTTTNITNWTYDYSDRSYTCTTENNTTTTITYGDEYITINEGDVNNTYITYNIYYYTAPEDSGDGSGSGSDGEGSGSSGSGDSSDDGDGIGGGLGELLGSLLGGLIDLITGLISGLIDSLINLVEMTIEKLGQVVNLFGEFGDALKVLWSWLPDEVVTILAAGVSVVVFASVIKLFV